MKKLIIALTVIASCVSIVGCSALKEQKLTPTHISNEYLIGKKFGFGSMMGARSFYFIDSTKVNFIIYDKTIFGYNGTYTISYDNGKQYIKIKNREKFGLESMLEYLPEEVTLEVNSQTQLTDISTNETYEIVEIVNFEQRYSYLFVLY